MIAIRIWSGWDKNEVAKKGHGDPGWSHGHMESYWEALTSPGWVLRDG